MSEMSRRDFIKAALGVPIGVATGVALCPVADFTNRKTEEFTSHPSGNAIVMEKVQTACANDKDPAACERNYNFSLSDKILSTVVAPIEEEFIFRAVPSLLIDVTSPNEQPGFETLIHGTEHMKVTRKELIVGAISSLMFGAVHNLTEKGVDTKTIPASQTVTGFVFWALQRRLGIASNIAAHSAINVVAVNSK